MSWNVMRLAFRFEETSVEWILKQRPSGLLPALEELAKYLIEKLREGSTSKANHVCGEGEMAHPSRQLLMLTRMLTKIVWWVCMYIAAR